MNAHTHFYILDAKGQIKRFGACHPDHTKIQAADGECLLEFDAAQFADGRPVTDSTHMWRKGVWVALNAPPAP